MAARTSRPPLSQTHPDLAAEADGWDPSHVTAGSNQRLAWACVCGHRWEARVSNRTAAGSRCPGCGPARRAPRRSRALSDHAHVVAQSVGWDPELVNAASNSRRTWRCERGHTWAARVNNRTVGGSGCPQCAGRRAQGVHLGLTHPLLAAQADGWDAATVTAGSKQVRPWVCAAGHRWTARVCSRSAGTGCPVCVGRFPVVRDA